MQGSWRVVEFAGDPNPDDDYWEFEGDRFTQNLGGQRLSPDAFEIDGSVIDLGVFALGCMPRKSVRRGEGQTDLPVTFGGVTFRPDDHVYADANGAVVADRPID